LQNSNNRPVNLSLLSLASEDASKKAFLPTPWEWIVSGSRKMKPPKHPESLKR